MIITRKLFHLHFWDKSEALDTMLVTSSFIFKTQLKTWPFNERNESKLESLKQKTQNMALYQKTQNTPHCFRNTIDLEFQNSTILHHAYYKLEKGKKTCTCSTVSICFLNSTKIPNTTWNTPTFKARIAEIGRCMHYK
jgi:hypothetical protein